MRLQFQVRALRRIASQLEVEKMERCFLIAVTIMLLSATTVLAEGTGDSKSKEWPYGPYDKLQTVPVKTLPIVIIGSENQGTTTNGSRTILMSEEERFRFLSGAAKESFVAGKIEDARKYAQELMTLIPKFQGHWNYGNAIQDANLVLGRIAVREGRIQDAKRFLIEAGKSPGSPQMDSFGPNMSLAKDLLEKGERDVVLKYFDLCRKFWETHKEYLDQWTKDVKGGKVPDFGANLVY